jgi:hypothetical protein
VGKNISKEPLSYFPTYFFTLTLDPLFEVAKSNFLLFSKRKMKFEMFLLPSFVWLMVEEGKWKVSLEIESRFAEEGRQHTSTHFDIHIIQHVVHTELPVRLVVSEPIIPVINLRVSASCKPK